MKIYIVTCGEYSDYHIDKVFTDRAKAEEYRKWCYEANDVEEYDTEDDYHIDKFYNIIVCYRVHDDGINNKPNIGIKCCSNKYVSYTNVDDRHRFGHKYFDICICRYIPEVNWNEEFYVNKYTNAIYDLAAQARQLLSEGFTDRQINEMWNQAIKD